MSSAGDRGAAGSRVWSGLAVAAAGLALLTAVLVPNRSQLGLGAAALLYLVPVVATAMVGGVGPALVAAVAADLLVNFFFVPPYHTLVVESGEHVVVLVVYVLVAAAVSAAVDVAARQRVRAARRELEVRLLAAASAQPVVAQSLTVLLERVRDTFSMTTVALLESGPDGERDVVQVGEPPSGRPVLSAAAGDGLRLVAWGPELFAEDRRTLDRMAAAAARTLETQRLADEAARVRDLAEIDRVRAALLAAVGHDRRTPLAGIKAAVSGLRTPGLELSASARAELLSTIEESADRLADLVDNLLSMSRLQAGALSVHREAVAADAVVAQALLHADPGSQVVMDVPDDLPLIDVDPGLLERVVANLVANARAATAPGTRVSVLGRRVDDGVQLDVVDHGPGVPVEERERIFAPFQRLHDRGRGTGLGLGLAIARGFAEAMDGTVVPAETPGGGLTMSVTVPLADVRQATA
jgi:K+-sensing histidine kinase KdpD